MTTIASAGTRLPVRSRTNVVEGSAITVGEIYEANYDVEGTMTRRQAIEFIREIRRRSLDYADAVLFQYAGVDESSPQTITYQFKGLSSTRSPFVVTGAVILTGIILAAKAALILGGVIITLKALSEIQTGISAPFVPVETTTYIDPETGAEYGTYEEYAFAWDQRHPGTTVPEPGTQVTSSASWTTTVIGLTVIVVMGLLVYYIWTKYGSGGFKSGK